MSKRTAVVVIGSGYGDEGKGHMVDYYARQMDDPVVVRFNGGAQAGHTVVTPEGHRHVFSHFGSGTFTKAPTFLSRFFVVNPLLFKKEHKQFVKEFGFAPRVFVDPHCLVTTPYEMLINQSLEQMRGDDPHGSCGVGFGETLERVARTGSRLYVGVAVSMSKRLADAVIDLRREYIPTRVDLTQVGQPFIDAYNSDELVEDFFDAIRYMRDHITIMDVSHIQRHNLIFEGAQGLLLDQDYGYFPNVTRSNTGMRNVNALLRDELITDLHHLTVNYVTRAYTTRHGAGPLDNEQPLPSWVKDETNIPNEFQGALRYAPLDFGLFHSTTDKDFALYGNEHNGQYDVRKVRTITCVDQLPTDDIVVTDDRKVLHFHPSVLVDQLFPQMFDYISTGPTRVDISAMT